MYQPQPGDRLETLDTPAVLIDLYLMEANISRLMEQLRPTGVKIRPHLKTVKSPALAHRLLAAGATGGCVAKLGEAAVMAEGGIEDLLLTTELAGSPKLARLVELLQRYPRLKLRVVVDGLPGATALHNALVAANLQLDVLIDLNVGQNRCGILPGAPALALAHELAKLDTLRLIGVKGYEGHLQHLTDEAERAQRCREAMALLTGTAQQLREAGFNIEVVTTGGTGTAFICASYPGVTEVQPGSFIFMDAHYRAALGPASYANALTVLATVISRPASNRAVVDAGLKSLSTDSGPAQPFDLPGVTYRPGGDEHGILEWDEAASQDAPLAIGDRVALIPSHIDTTINLHDYYYAHRNGRLEAIWPIAARGKVQ